MRSFTHDRENRISIECENAHESQVAGGNKWERIISHKLEIIDGLYARLNDRIRTAQSQTMELAIVALIVVELLLALFK